MKSLRTLTIIFGVVAGMSSAHAANVDYTDHLGKVTDTTSSVVLTTLNFLGGKGEADVTGRLPADTEIVFTYTFTPSAANGLHSTSLDTSTVISGFSDYDFTLGHGKHHTEYSGAAYGNSSGTDWSHGEFERRGADHHSDSLVTVLANINPTTGIGTTTIINNSSSTAYFSSLIDAFKRLYGNVTVSYAVSAVPLPGALPLFASALVGVFFLGRRKTNLRD
jgi:hypothetical protein